MSLRNEISSNDLGILIFSISTLYQSRITGGPLHIILDDLNVDNESIQWCLDNSIRSEQNDFIRITCQLIANRLLMIKDLDDRIYIIEASR